MESQRRARGRSYHAASCLAHSHPACCALSACCTAPHPPHSTRTGRSSITRQHLADYIASNYTAPRMVISAAGAVDHGALVAAAEKAFAKLPSGGKSAGDLVKEVGPPAAHAGSMCSSRQALPAAPPRPPVHRTLPPNRPARRPPRCSPAATCASATPTSPT